MRTKHEDEPKSERQQQLIFEKNITCAHNDCNELVTFFKGPGSDKYCREHQLQLIAYGGYGRSGREHTFHRADVCDCCGQDMLRVKGIVNVEGKPVVVQGVQHIFSPPIELDKWPSADRDSRLVFITRNMESDAIRNLMGAVTALGASSSTAV